MALCPENLVGCSFIMQRKVGLGKRPLSYSFLSRYYVSNFSSSSNLSRDIFLSLLVQAGTVMALRKMYVRSQYNEGISL